jgi:hypothetical protein
MRSRRAASTAQLHRIADRDLAGLDLGMMRMQAAERLGSVLHHALILSLVIVPASPIWPPDSP